MKRLFNIFLPVSMPGVRVRGKVVFWTLLVFLSISGCQKVKINGFEKSYIYRPDMSDDSNFIHFTIDNNGYYPYPKTNNGYEEAGKNLKNPLSLTIENLDKGKEIYMSYCQHCHGKEGKSDAPMILKNKFPPPPNYEIRIKTITEGKMFHSITWGKNLMPSFKNDLTTTQKWQVVLWVKKLAGNEK